MCKARARLRFLACRSQTTFHGVTGLGPRSQTWSKPPISTNAMVGWFNGGANDMDEMQGYFLITIWIYIFFKGMVCMTVTFQWVSPRCWSCIKSIGCAFFWLWWYTAPRCHEEGKKREVRGDLTTSALIVLISAVLFTQRVPFTHWSWHLDFGGV